jgi:hypothetical protein
MVTQIQFGQLGNPDTLNQPLNELEALILAGSNSAIKKLSQMVTTVNQSVISLSVTDLTFDKLNIRAYLRSTQVSVLSDFSLRFNNDSTTANYYLLRNVSNGSSITQVNQFADVSGGFLFANGAPGASASAGRVLALDLTVGFYRDSRVKNILFNGVNFATNVPAEMLFYEGGGTWNSTDIVTSVQLVNASGWLAGATVVLYGVR